MLDLDRDDLSYSNYEYKNTGIASSEYKSKNRMLRAISRKRDDANLIAWKFPNEPAENFM